MGGRGRGGRQKGGRQRGAGLGVWGVARACRQACCTRHWMANNHQLYKHNGQDAPSSDARTLVPFRGGRGWVKDCRLQIGPSSPTAAATASRCSTASTAACRNMTAALITPARPVSLPVLCSNAALYVGVTARPVKADLRGLHTRQCDGVRAEQLKPPVAVAQSMCFSHSGSVSRSKIWQKLAAPVLLQHLQVRAHLVVGLQKRQRTRQKDSGTP